jgi:uncharacterized protein
MNTPKMKIVDVISAKNLYQFKQLVNNDNANQIFQDNECYLSTMLLYAIDQKWKEGVKVLIECGADIHLHLDWEIAPLGLAVINRDLDIVKILLESGANPNHGGIDTFPLHDAVALGESEIMKILIDEGAEKNSVNHAGFTPLMIAANQGSLVSAMILVEAGVCISLVNYERQETALNIAIKQKNHEVSNYLFSLK